METAVPQKRWDVSTKLYVVRSQRKPVFTESQQMIDCHLCLPVLVKKIDAFQVHMTLLDNKTWQTYLTLGKKTCSCLDSNLAPTEVVDLFFPYLERLGYNSNFHDVYMRSFFLLSR